MQRHLLCLACIHWITGDHEGAFDGGGAFSVVSGTSTKLPVTTEPKWVHLSRGGRESQRVLPKNCTVIWKMVSLLTIIPIYPSRRLSNITVCTLMLIHKKSSMYSIFEIKWVKKKMCKVNFYLPHEICVTTFPMSSNTFLGLISWFVELCPSCPYPPAPNVNTPPSCKMQDQQHWLFWWSPGKRVLQGQNVRRHHSIRDWGYCVIDLNPVVY